ncbi:MAG: hypothetical protein ACLQDM_29965, partial [Bradyrhizobium sp.]
MKMNFDFRTRWRATTALCIVSTLAVGTVAYAADWGRSSWDRRPHSHDGHQSQNGNDGNNDNDAGRNETAKTASPIKHVIVLIGENRGLDHTFGVYKPKGAGQTISNLLSKGIVNEDGSPGPNFAKAQQFSVAGQPAYYIGAPNAAKFAYSPTNAMPQPNTNGAPSAQSDTGAPFKTIAEASVEKDMDPASLDILTTGARNAGVERAGRQTGGAGGQDVDGRRVPVFFDAGFGNGLERSPGVALRA